MPQITQLDNDPTPNNNDLLVTVDMAAGTTKNISREQFFTGAPLPANTVDSQAIADGAVGTHQLDLDYTVESSWEITDLGVVKLYRKTVNPPTGALTGGQYGVYNMTTPPPGISVDEEPQITWTIASNPHWYTVNATRNGGSWALSIYNRSTSSGTPGIKVSITLIK